MKKRVTIHDIARKLNTTASTVSRALQNHPRISQEMRRKVQQTAREMNYRPDEMAVNLRKGQRNILGVIVPQVDRHFFARVIRGIEEEAGTQGYHILIGQSYEKVEREVHLTEKMGKGVVEGLLISVSLQTRDYQHIQRLIEQEVPLVFFDRVPEEVHADSVVIDDFEAAFQVTEHLIRSGCRNLAHFAGPNHINIYRERSNGFLAAMNQYRLKINTDWMLDNVLTKETGYRAMKFLWSQRIKPDAIVSSGDYSALGALLWCKEYGVEVPGRMCITGFANEPFTSLITPGMTSVEQHGFEMGKKAASLLLERVQGKYSGQDVRKIVIPSELHIRESSSRMVLKANKKQTKPHQ